MQNSQSLKDIKDGLRFDPTKGEGGRWYWQVYKTAAKDWNHVFTITKKGVVLSTGREFRRAGNNADRAQALRDRKAAEAEYHRQVDSPNTPDEDKPKAAVEVTVEEWAREMLGTPEQKGYWLRLGRKQTTVDAYAYSVYNYIAPEGEKLTKLREIGISELGPMPLRELNKFNIQIWANEVDAAKGGNVAGNALCVLQSMLTAAEESRKVDYNAALKVKVDRPEPADKMRLTPEDLDRLEAAAVGTNMQWPIFFGRYFGMRVGETKGMKWSDIDLENGKLYVPRQLQYHKGKRGLQEQTPKTKKKNDKPHEIPISERLIPILAEAKKNATSIYVSIGPNGRIIGAKKESHAFKRVALAAGFKPVEEGGRGVPTHRSLRHALSSALEELGVADSVYSAIIGHSNPQTTKKHYVLQAEEARKRDALDRVMEA